MRKKSDKTKKTKQDQLKTISTTQLNSNPDNSMMFNNDLYSNSDNQFKTTGLNLNLRKKKQFFISSNLRFWLINIWIFK